MKKSVLKAKEKTSSKKIALGSPSLRAQAKGDQGVTRTDAYTIHPSRLEIEPGFNLRNMASTSVREQIDAFKTTITAAAREAGTPSVPDLSDIIPRLKVRVNADGKILVREGHLRTQAIRELIAEGWDIHRVPVETFHSKDEALDTVLIMTSASGLGLSMLEQAKGVKRLADKFGWGAAKIAQHLGGTRTLASVEQHLKIARAPEDAQQLVEDGLISATTLLTAARRHGDNVTAVLKEQLETAKASGKKLSTRSARGIVRHRDVSALKLAVEAIINDIGAAALLDPDATKKNYTLTAATLQLLLKAKDSTETISATPDEEKSEAT